MENIKLTKEEIERYIKTSNEITKWICDNWMTPIMTTPPTVNQPDTSMHTMD